MTSPPGWLEPPTRRAGIIYLIIALPATIFLLLSFIFFGDPTYLIVWGIGAVMMVIFIIAIKASKDPDLQYTSKRYEDKRPRDIESIAEALTTAGVPFRRAGPGNPNEIIQTLETFVIETERLKMIVRDNITHGILVMVGPVDLYNKVSIESIQTIIDEALG